MKEVKIKKLYTDRSHLYNILAKTKQKECKTAVMVSLRLGEELMAKKQHEEMLGSVEHPLWYYDGQYTTPWDCQNPQYCIPGRVNFIVLKFLKINQLTEATQDTQQTVTNTYNCVVNE